MHFCVVLNEKAGTLAREAGRDWRRLVLDGFMAAGHQVECEMVAPGDLKPALERAAQRPVDGVVVGGGDGTLATAAEIMMRAGRTLGVLPFGTMNLLAKDLGVPLEPDAAITALARGEVRRMDVAEVNGRLFLSHAVIGLYPRMVRERERQRAELGIGKWPAMAWAALAILPRSPMLEASLLLEQGARDVSAAALAVSNNPLAPGDRSLARPRLDDGRLGVYVAKHRGLIERIRLMASLAFGTWQDDDEMETFTARQLDVVTRRGRPVTVALDGDLHRLPQPLRFRIRPQALSVLWPAVPAEAPVAASAGTP